MSQPTTSEVHKSTAITSSTNAAVGANCSITNNTPNVCGVVIEHLHCTVPFLAGKQDLMLRHCVHKVFVSPFYGEFTIYDQTGRTLGRSKDSKLSFVKEDLQTECAQVWYDAMATLQGQEHQVLRTKYHVLDPGLFFHFGTVSIEFDQAPAVDSNKVYRHIPVFFNITNVWNPQKKETLFR
jgi:hypothetical protein